MFLPATSTTLATRSLTVPNAHGTEAPAYVSRPRCARRSGRTSVPAAATCGYSRNAKTLPNVTNHSGRPARECSWWRAVRNWTPATASRASRGRTSRASSACSEFDSDASTHPRVDGHARRRSGVAAARAWRDARRRLSVGACPWNWRTRRRRRLLDAGDCRGVRRRDALSWLARRTPAVSLAAAALPHAARGGGLLRGHLADRGLPFRGCDRRRRLLARDCRARAVRGLRTPRPRLGHSRSEERTRRAPRAVGLDAIG